ncbi:hypothetical protein FKM82_031318 [Ascaphus truei]
MLTLHISFSLYHPSHRIRSMTNSSRNMHVTCYCITPLNCVVFNCCFTAERLSAELFSNVDISPLLGCNPSSICFIVGYVLFCCVYLGLLIGI